MCSSDLVGGEEFAILLPGASLEAARTFAERLRQHTELTPCRTGELSIPITVSIGIAAMHAGDADSDVVLQSADKALYRAKEAGRNRVELAS